MKRHVQTVGVREWAGDDLVELQREPLAALDAFFAEYGPCVVQGCKIMAREDGSGTFDVASGLVALEAEDPDGVQRVMTMPFPGAAGVALPLYLTASVETLTDVYGDGKVKPIAYVYEAQASGVDPGEAVPHLTLTADGGNRFVDVVQDPAHRFVSDTDRARWNSILAQAKAYADSVSATGSEAALRTAKEYTDTREVAILASADSKDADTLQRAKAYADQIVAALAGSAPETLDTLQELAAALGDDPNFSATVMQLIGERVTTEALNAALKGAIVGRGWDSDLNTNSVGTGFQRFSEGSGVVGPYVSFGHANYIAQLTVGYTNYQNMANGLKYRTRDGDTGAWNPWNTIWHSGNFDPAGKADAPATIQNGDLNALVSNGLYTVDGGAISNAPVSTLNCRVLVIATNDYRVTQIAQPYDSDRLFFRRRIDALWQPWRELWHSGNFDPNNKQEAALEKYDGDCDQWTEQGRVYYVGMDNTARTIAHAPSQYAFGLLYIPHANGTQIAFDYQGGIYFRTFHWSAGWRPWQTLYHTGNLGPATTSTSGLMSAADKQKLDGITGIVAAGRVAGSGQVVCTTSGVNASYNASGKYYTLTFPSTNNPVLQVTPFDKDGKTDLWGKVCCTIKTLTTSSAQIVMTDSGGGEHIQAGFCFSLISC